MTRPDVNGDAMRDRTFSDRAIEQLLTGQGPDDVELAELVPLVTLLRGNAVPPSEESIARFAASAAGIVARSLSQGANSPLEMSPLRFRRVEVIQRWRLVAGLAAVVAFGAAAGAVAAADGAAPGNPLYGLDRALENVGVGNGGVVERLAEAAILTESGNEAEALGHAADAIGQASPALGDGAAALEALASAAEQIRSIDEGSEHADMVRARVADMLEWMASSDVRGHDFGQMVAEMAKGIAGNDSSGGGPPEGAGPPDGTGPPDVLPNGPPGGGPPGPPAPRAP
jgi:hypothetical protein